MGYFTDLEQQGNGFVFEGFSFFDVYDPPAQRAMRFEGRYDGAFVCLFVFERLWIWYLENWSPPINSAHYKFLPTPYLLGLRENLFVRVLVLSICHIDGFFLRCRRLYCAKHMVSTGLVSDVCGVVQCVHR